MSLIASLRAAGAVLSLYQYLQLVLLLHSLFSLSLSAVLQGWFVAYIAFKIIFVASHATSSCFGAKFQVISVPGRFAANYYVTLPLKVKCDHRSKFSNFELFHIYFTWFHCTGRYELNKLTLLPMCGFIAQLVEHRTGIAEVMGSNPVEALIFFRLLLSSCLNWKIYCDDHTSLSSTTAVQIWIISYIFHMTLPLFNIISNRWQLTLTFGKKKIANEASAESITDRILRLLGSLTEYWKDARQHGIGFFVSFPQKRNGIVFSSGVNYLHSGGNIQS